MVKVVVDAHGGDNSPNVNVTGAIEAVKKIEDLQVILVGHEDKINALLKDNAFESERLKVVHAPDEITCNDKPTEAIRHKTESSLYRAIEILKTEEGADALVSIGSTGALLAGAVLKIGRIKGVKRPAFCPIMPTMAGGVVGICDSGANVDCDSLQLYQFAVMGSLYFKKALGVENPRVALLNVGVEEEKGDALRKEVYAMLKNAENLNFVGNMESRDLLKGDYDIVVCDGFSGNVLLKSTEGACLEMLKMLKRTFTKNFKNKMGALLLKKDIIKTKDFMDYNNYGGAVLLGAAKTVVKGHGSGKAISVYHCIRQAYEMEKNGLRAEIASALASRING